MEPCPQCAAIGISRARLLRRPDDAKALMISLASLADMRKRRQCPICRLVAGTAETASFAGWNDDTSGSIQSSWVNRRTSEPDFVSVNQGSFRINPDTPQLFLRLMDPSPQAPHSGRPIPPAIDVALARAWLRECTDDHATCRRRTEHASEGAIYLIDVDSWCIRAADLGAAYLALSYVWGGVAQLQLLQANFDQLTQPGGLKDVVADIRSTITDAVEFTRLVGLQYLWVDAVCIVQDDLAHKMASIAQMDRIYQCAAATIVAAGGADADAGLPGVGPRPRDATQLVEAVEAGCSLLAQVSHPEHVRRAVYSSRGWTFQEYQLSARAFIFASDRVFFSCLERTFAEDVQAEQLPHADAMHWASQHRRTLYQAAPLFTHYVWAVQQYTARQLTHISDKLAAFTGVLAALCRGLGCEPVHGLPAKFFDVALLWQPLYGGGARIPGFPSWSWAGWEGEAMWYNDELLAHVANTEVSSEQEEKTVGAWMRERTWIRWELLDTDTGTARLVAEPSGTGPKDHGLPELHRPTPSEAPSYSAPYDLLTFATLSARFIITYNASAQTTNIRFGSADPYPADRLGVVTFKLLNCRREPCGWVQLDEAWRAETDTEHEFLVLAEADYYMDYCSLRPHLTHPYTRGGKVSMTSAGWEEVYVMMVREVEGSMERAGVGRLMKGALEDGCGEGARWREVALR